jgi:hypothetical protein
MQTSGLRKGSCHPHPKSKFSADEDALLVSLVHQFGTECWAKVAKLIDGRNARQCRDRWLNYLSPEVSLAPWTMDEEVMLMRTFIEFGPRWRVIASFFITRSDVNIKNHWQLMQRRARRGGMFSIGPYPPRQAKRNADVDHDEPDETLWGTFVMGQGEASPFEFDHFCDFDMTEDFCKK